MRRGYNTILGNKLCNTLRYDGAFNYEAILLDLTKLPKRFHQTIFDELPFDLFLSGDTIHYKKTDDDNMILAMFDYGSAQEQKGLYMIVTAELDSDKSILYICTRRSDREDTWSYTYYVDENLWIVADVDKTVKHCDIEYTDHIDIDIYQSIIASYKKAGMTHIVVYDEQYYRDNWGCNPSDNV